MTEPARWSAAWRRPNVNLALQISCVLLLRFMSPLHAAVTAVHNQCICHAPCLFITRQQGAKNYIGTMVSGIIRHHPPSKLTFANIMLLGLIIPLPANTKALRSLMCSTTHASADSMLSNSTSCTVKSTEEVVRKYSLKFMVILTLSNFYAGYVSSEPLSQLRPIRYGVCIPFMARRAGIEPATRSLEGCCSIQLS